MKAKKMFEREGTNAPEEQEVLGVIREYYTYSVVLEDREIYQVAPYETVEDLLDFFKEEGECPILIYELENGVILNYAEDGEIDDDRVLEPISILTEK